MRNSGKLPSQRRFFNLRFGALAALLMTTSLPAAGATLMVGAGQTYKSPSDAARGAKPGDTVRIAPGTYYDCAVWDSSGLTIEGTGAGVILTDKICQGKAIFVVHADNVTVNNITFARARSGDGNGAGIRAEGRALTVENSKFENNQDGILEGDIADATTTIRNSVFDHNGACEDGMGCAHGVYVGHIALLRIEHSRFVDTQAGHHIKSRAARTEIVDSRIQDGPGGTASYLVDLPNGGSLLLTGNLMEKGPANGNHSAAVTIGEEGVGQPTKELIVSRNTFTNDGPATVFLRNLSATPANLTGNKLTGNDVTALSGDGAVH